MDTASNNCQRHEPAQPARALGIVAGCRYRHRRRGAGAGRHPVDRERFQCGIDRRHGTGKRAGDARFVHLGAGLRHQRGSIQGGGGSARCRA